MTIMRITLIVIFSLALAKAMHVPQRNSENVIKMRQSHSKKSFSDQPASKCGVMVPNFRFDCQPDGPVTQQSCESRGCCYTPVKGEDGTLDVNVPWCYFPPDYPSYSISTYERTDMGYTAEITRSVATHWPNDVMKLRVDAIFEDRGRLHIKIYDPKNSRYEVPIETPPPPKRGEPGLEVNFFSKPFGMTVSAGMEGSPIIDTNLVGAPLIFSDQFIQLSTRLPSPYIYGLGEHKEHLLINASTGWQQRAFWARDVGPQFNTNLYGVHPFYMGTIPGEFYGTGLSYGVFLLNSNAMEVDIQPMPALTWRTIGGILDLYVFYGQSPDEVVQQYLQVIGNPYLPPYWSLGFHLCRYGYLSSKRLKEIIDRNKAIGMPYDVQWSDIDYMDAHKDWTYDTKAYEDLPDIVNSLHTSSMKYVIIIDPGINVLPGYGPYDDGIKSDIFIKDANGKPIVGQVWPGDTVFPDFTHPDAYSWWLKYAKSYHQQVPFDGLWTDMNEPSNFVPGSKSGCTNNNLDKPPFTPGILDNNLFAKTLCPSAKQHLGSHYNLHSLYGHFEVKASRDVLVELNNKRPLVISRSTFASTGKYGGHWSGDISSTWEDLAYSIPELLAFQMFGIPLVGADICGFGGEATEELCVRWMQLGAFYPFMRNHNTFGAKDQDPGAFSISAQGAMKTATALRYSLLPYLYSLFVASHLNGSTVARPYFFIYPLDPEAVAIDEQFFWGNGLLITPVLTQGATSVKGYFNANDTFYDVYDGSAIANGGWQTLDAPLSKINVHVRGGSIIPTLPSPSVTTAQSRQTPFCLLVALGVKHIRRYVPIPKPHEIDINITYAHGELYWDDGESLDSIDAGKFNHIVFEASKNNITSTVIKSGYNDPHQMSLTSIKILGMADAPSKVMVNSMPAKMHVEQNYIVISGFNVSLMRELLVTWA